MKEMEVMKVMKARARRALLCLACITSITLTTTITAVSHASEHELVVQTDTRVVIVDSSLDSFTEGGTGLLRFDEHHDALQLGRLMVDASGPLAETLRYTLTLSATDDGDQNPIDLTEAYIDWRPYPTTAWRWRTRVGAFYAPVSLENRTIGWQSLYSLSPSAINTWMGEESRTIGAEVAATWAGAHSSRDFDVTLLAATYQWNDPFGVVIFQRGWAIHDRQSPLFGDLPRPFVRDPSNSTMEFFDEIDDRIGYYVGGEVRWRSDVLVRAMHYDNLGDPDDATAKEPAWRTRFDAIGWRWELPYAISFLAQGMLGDTEVGPQGTGHGMFLTEFWSYYALLSQAHGPHRYTVRYDRMYTDTERGAEMFNSEQNAQAWTLAYLFDLNAHWQFAIEGLRITGSLAQRTKLALPAHATERQLQVGVRWTF